MGALVIADKDKFEEKVVKRSFLDLMPPPDTPTIIGSMDPLLRMAIQNALRMSMVEEKKQDLILLQVQTEAS